MTDTLPMKMTLMKFLQNIQKPRTDFQKPTPSVNRDVRFALPLHAAFSAPSYGKGLLLPLFVGSKRKSPRPAFVTSHRFALTIYTTCRKFKLR